MSFRFSGTLTDKDAKRHIPHRFQVADGTTYLLMDFNFAPVWVEGVQNMVTLTLFDPNGCRGAGHKHGGHHAVRLEAGYATPGYLAGPLPTGEWIVQIDTHMVMPGEPVPYTLTVEMGSIGTAGTGARKPLQLSQSADTLPPRTGPGWYRGDLHTHTNHSDSRRSVAELVDAARRKQSAPRLDFIFLTDHNTVSGLSELAHFAGGDLALMGGIELTTFWGHALCLGAHEWVDWRVGRDDGGMDRIAEETYARGQVFVIAHPKSLGDPYCTGCRWVYPSMMPGTARLVEIWNGSWKSNNEEAVALWYSWLNQGLAIKATAGTDSHHADNYKNPTNGYSVVYAQELSERAILDALMAGHLYLSAGPTLTFEARTPDGDKVMMGDTLEADEASFTASWSDCPADAEARIVQDGEVVARVAADTGSRKWQGSTGKGRWWVVELRAGPEAEARLLAITNPITLRAK